MVARIIGKYKTGIEILHFTVQKMDSTVEKKIILVAN